MSLRELRAIALSLIILGMLFLFFWMAFGRSNDTTKLAELRLENQNLEQRLEDFQSAGKVGPLPRELLWVGTDQAEAEFALQDQVTRLVQELGLDLYSFGISNNGPETGLEYVSLELELEGEAARFYDMLDALENMTPKVAIESMILRPIDFASNEFREMVSVTMVVWGFWGTGE